MDEALYIVPDEELNNTCLIYSSEAKAIDANQKITDNMQLPADSQTERWDTPDKIINGNYAGFWFIKKPEVNNPALLEGVEIEIESEYEPSWFEETE